MENRSETRQLKSVFTVEKDWINYSNRFLSENIRGRVAESWQGYLSKSVPSLSLPALWHLFHEIPRQFPLTFKSKQLCLTKTGEVLNL